MEQEKEIYRLLALGENEEVEFKSGKGGFPRDFWETYSAFANTRGGVVVLGVKEKENQLSLSGLSKEEAEKLKEQFWRSVHNKETISHCLLKNEDVRVIAIGQAFVVVFSIPQASREQRPVYCKRIADEGTYRRNASGDFLCSAAEVRRMMADADLSRPADGRILKGFTWEDIDLPSFEQYRRLFATVKPTHAWLSEDNDGLMRRLGGYRKERETGEEGFTLAGLLMFGKYESIQACAPHFFPDYKEITSDTERWSDRLCPDGTWEANLFQFYRRVLPKLQENLPIPFQLEEGQRRDETQAHEALREALANLCVHADYQDVSSLLVNKYRDKIVFSNPGVLLISTEQFFRGGESVCRNRSLQQMFMMMGAVEKAGSGVDKILKGWDAVHRSTPYLEERVAPNKVELIMPLTLANLATSDTKPCNLEEQTLQPTLANIATSDTKPCNLEDDTLQPTPRKLSEAQRTELICHYCVDWKSVQQIATYLGRNKDYIRNAVLPALIKSGKLEMLYPQVENHPQQQYKTRASVTSQE